MNNFGMGNGQRKGMGNGLGRGRGQGDRPIAPDETATYTSKVKQQLKKGKAVFQGLTTPNKHRQGGRRHRDSGGDRMPAPASAADALSNQKIPKTPRKTHPVVLRPAQQGKLTTPDIRFDIAANATRRLLRFGTGPELLPDLRPSPKTLVPTLCVGTSDVPLRGALNVDFGKSFLPDSSIMRIILERTRESLKVRARLDEPHVGEQCRGFDQGIKGHIIQVELARDRDEHAVGMIFNEGTAGPNAELAAQDHVKRMRQAAAGLVSQLQAGDSPFLSSALGVFRLDELGHVRASSVCDSEMLP